MLLWNKFIRFISFFIGFFSLSERKYRSFKKDLYYKILKAFHDFLIKKVFSLRHLIFFISSKIITSEPQSENFRQFYLFILTLEPKIAKNEI